MTTKIGNLTTEQIRVLKWAIDNDTLHPYHVKLVTKYMDDPDKEMTVIDYHTVKVLVEKNNLTLRK